MRVALGLILTNGFPVPAPFVLSLAEQLNAILSGAVNRGLPADLQVTDLRIISSQGFPTDTARNDVCRTFLDGDGGEWLLFLDADMRHPSDLLARLLLRRHPLITARYQMRKPPFHTVAMRKVGAGPRDYKAIEEQAGCVPIDAAGAGALLIHRDVLAAVRAHVGADDWFRYQADGTGLRTVSEDMWFFEQARACGLQPWCDLDVVCGHLAQFEVDLRWQTPWLQARDAAGAAKALVEAVASA